MNNNKKCDGTCTQLMHQMIRLRQDAVNLLKGGGKNLKMTHSQVGQIDYVLRVSCVRLQ